MIRTVILGMGTISVVHLTALEAMSDKAEIVGLCDTDPAKLETYRDLYPIYTDLDEMLAEVQPDVCHVCLPHAEHLPAIEKLMAAGVAAFTEKPITANAAQTDDLLALSREEGAVIGVCFQNRYNPTFLNALELVRSGTYGNLRFVRGRVPWFRPLDYYKAAPWRGSMRDAGGGVMINQAIHTLDQMLVLGGGQAETVRGMIGNLLDYPIEVEDTALARFSFANGAIGLFEATISHIANEPVELKIYLERAILEIRSGALSVLELGTEEPPGQPSELCRDIPLDGAKSYYGSGHSVAIRTFYQALTEGSEDYIHVADAAPSIYTIEAIRESSEGRQAPAAIRQVDAELLQKRWTEADIKEHA